MLSTRGLTGLDKYLIGSVADRVARLAPCPVVLIRRGKRSLGRNKNRQKCCGTSTNKNEIVNTNEKDASIMSRLRPLSTHSEARIKAQTARDDNRADKRRAHVLLAIPDVALRAEVCDPEIGRENGEPLTSVPVWHNDL
jgi:hypothetical protein